MTVIYLIWICMLLPFLYGIWHIRNYDNINRGFIYFLGISFVFDVFNAYVGYFFKDNQWVFRMFLILDLVFFVWYYHNIFENPLWNLWINMLFIAVLVFTEVISSQFKSVNSLASWYHLLLFVFFIIQSALAIITTFKTYENNILKYPVFWISFGRLFYFLLIVFVFVYPRLVYKGLENKLIGDVNSYINIFANFCLYIMYGIGILCLKMKK